MRIWRQGAKAAGLLSTLISVGASGVASAPEPPLSTPIVIGGDFSDWTEVLTNPRNSSRDGEGSSLA